MIGGPLRGWSLVAWTAVVVGGAGAGTLALEGAGEGGLLAVLRATARTSLLLFLCVFLASTARGCWANRATEWLLDNRRYLGVSFATSHAVHLGAIVGLTRVSAHRPDVTVLVLGGVGFLLILAMTVTSFDRTAALLGARRWHRLHTAGIYYVWAIFTLTYLGNAAKDPKGLRIGRSVVRCPGLSARSPALAACSRYGSLSYYGRISCSHTTILRYVATSKLRLVAAGRLR